VGVRLFGVSQGQVRNFQMGLDEIAIADGGIANQSFSHTLMCSQFAKLDVKGRIIEVAALSARCLPFGRNSIM